LVKTLMRFLFCGAGSTAVEPLSPQPLPLPPHSAPTSDSSQPNAADADAEPTLPAERTAIVPPQEEVAADGAEASTFAALAPSLAPMRAPLRPLGSAGGGPANARPLPPLGRPSALPKLEGRVPLQELSQLGPGTNGDGGSTAIDAASFPSAAHADRTPAAPIARRPLPRSDTVPLAPVHLPSSKGAALAPLSSAGQRPGIALTTTPAAEAVSAAADAPPPPPKAAAASAPPAPTA